MTMAMKFSVWFEYNYIAQHRVVETSLCSCLHLSTCVHKGILLNRLHKNYYKWLQILTWRQVGIHKMTVLVPACQTQLHHRAETQVHTM